MVRNTLQITNHFLKMNDLKTAQFTLMNHPNITNDSKAIFYNDKKERNNLLLLFKDLWNELIKTK